MNRPMMRRSAIPSTALATAVGSRNISAASARYVRRTVLRPPFSEAIFPETRLLTSMTMPIAIRPTLT